MSYRLLNDASVPYCAGCGHHVVNHALQSSLESITNNIKNLTMVSDIGCCGLVDGLVNCHTVHGLHGRSVALATGIRLGLRTPGKKVIVILGDGGATIGLQHILEAARSNIDLTVLVLNNLVYGMTGGQFSGLTTSRMLEQSHGSSPVIPSYDLCSLVWTAGAVFSARTDVGKGLSEVLETAIKSSGFSLVEIIEPCPSHGVRKIRQLDDLMEYPMVRQSRTREVFVLPERSCDSLLDAQTVISPAFRIPELDRLSVVVAGSAGGAIQSASHILANAAMYAGLNVVSRGSYPVTVGTGYSVSELTFSSDELYTAGETTPDVFLIVSQAGLDEVKRDFQENSFVIAEAGLAGPVPASAKRFDFKAAGPKGSALAAISTWVSSSGIFPVEALRLACRGHKLEQILLKTIDQAPVPDSVLAL